MRPSSKSTPNLDPNLWRKMANPNYEKQKADRERLRLFKKDHPDEYAKMVERVAERDKPEAEEKDLELPLLLEYKTAFRFWNLALRPEGPRLISLNNTVWVPRRPLEARCEFGCGMSVGHPSRQRLQAGRVPHSRSDSTCGIYSLMSDDKREFQFQVKGTIAIWGKVVEHETGYRSQFAYPLSLGLSDNLVRDTPKIRLAIEEELSEVYNVDRYRRT